MSAGAAFAHTSESTAWYTPPDVIDAARALMGGIDLDPASCEIANNVVRAQTYYDEHDNGFNKPWEGSVFLNPPGGYCDKDGRLVVRAQGGARPCSETGSCGIPAPHTHENVKSAAKAWWCKLAEQWREEYVTEAVFIGFNAEILRSTQSEVSPCLAFPICHPAQRLKYYRERGGVLVPGASPPHESVIMWLPTAGDMRSNSLGALAKRMSVRFGKFGWCR